MSLQLLGECKGLLEIRPGGPGMPSIAVRSAAAADSIAGEKIAEIGKGHRTT